MPRGAVGTSTSVPPDSALGSVWMAAMPAAELQRVTLNSCTIMPVASEYTPTWHRDALGSGRSLRLRFSFGRLRVVFRGLPSALPGVSTLSTQPLREKGRC